MRFDLTENTITRHDLVAQNAIFSFRGEYFFLSNYAPTPVEMYGIRFPTVEAAFAAAKLDPNGGVHARADVLAEMRRIASAPTPGEAKRLGRRRTWNGKPFLRPDWDTVKIDLVFELIRRKFSDPALGAKLIATDDRPLWEGNTWNDRIWGVAERDGIYRGKNLLGQMLMAVRDELR